MSLLQRLTLLVLIVLIPVAAVEYYNVRALNSERMDEMTADSDRMLTVLLDDYRQLTQGVALTLSALSAGSGEIFSGRGDCRSILNKLAGDTPRWLSLSVVDMHGVIRCSTTAAWEGHIFPSAGLEGGNPGAGKTVALPFIRWPDAPAGAFRFVHAFSDASGEQGSVVAAVGSEWFSVTYGSPDRFGSGTSLSVMTPEGDLVYRTASGSSGIGTDDSLIRAAMTEVVGRQTRGVTAYSGGSGRRMAVYQPPSAAGAVPGLLIWIGVDTAAAVQGISAAGDRSFALLAVMFVFALFATWWGGYLVLRKPLAALRAISTRWREGDLGARTGWTGGSEIAAVGRIFDDLVSDLGVANAGRVRADGDRGRMEYLLEIANDGIFEIDSCGKVIAQNRRAQEMFSGGESGVGRPWASAMPGLSGTHLGTWFLGAMSSRQPLYFEADCPLTGIRLELRTFPTADGTAGYCHDVTQRKNAEDALGISEASHRAIFDAAQEATFILGSDGVIKEANPASSQIFGYSAAEMIGHRLTFLLPGLDDAACGNGRNRPGNLEIDCRRLDGSAFPGEISAIPWRSRTEVFVTVTVRNIAARKEARETIKRSSDLLDAILEASTDAIFVKDMRGNFKLVNSAMAAVHGLSRGAMVGMNESQLGTPVLKEEASMRRMEVIDKQRPLVFDLIMNTPGGGNRTMQTVYAPLFDQNGAMWGIAGFGRDVTEVRLAGDEMRIAKDKAEEADLSKGRFLASANHDLRQPLQAALLHAELVRLELENGRDPREGVTSLLYSLSILKAEMESLFDISHIDSGGVKPTVATFELEGLIKETMSDHLLDASAKGITLEADECDFHVVSDRGLLGRMLRNLVSNAVRYTHQGGVRISFLERGGNLVIEVRDTGVGINEQQHDLIWQEFEQLNNPDRDRSRGAGLGLSIVKRIGKLLSHKTSVSSVEGKGSVFSVSVPLSQSTACVGVAEVARPSGRSAATWFGHTAVVVDDDPVVLNGLRATLQSWGFRVLAAPDGKTAEALSMACEQVPGVILADYRLKAEKGTDVIDAVRACVNREIPGLILTGDTQISASDDVGGRGMRFLRKPITPDELASALASVLV